MDLLERFESLSEAVVDGYIAAGQEEHLQLDFKVASAGMGSSDDKRTFARALSGFANSSGGLIIWGVDARKNQQGVDAACDKKPIDNVALLLSRLNELTGEFVIPLVDGVRHRIICADESGRGLAATLIPESESGPHRARAGDEHYYKRSGDSFYRMEHFDLEDMFGRRKRPRLAIESRVELRGESSGGGHTRYNGILVIGIANSGRGSANAPFLEIVVRPPYQIDRYGLTGNGHEGLPRLAHAGSPSLQRYGGSRDTTIHPGTVLEVAAVDIGAGRTYDGKLEMPQPLVVEYAVAAEGVALATGLLELSSDDLASALYPPSVYVGKDERARIAAAQAS